MSLAFLRNKPLKYLPDNSPFHPIPSHPIPNLPPNFVLNLEITECYIRMEKKINFRDERNPSIGIIIIVCVRERERGRQVQTAYSDTQVRLDLTCRAGYLPG